MEEQSVSSVTIGHSTAAVVVSWHTCPKNQFKPSGRLLPPPELPPPPLPVFSLMAWRMLAKDWGVIELAAVWFAKALIRLVMVDLSIVLRY
jgi:hypothetical protein